MSSTNLTTSQSEYHDSFWCGALSSNIGDTDIVTLARSWRFLSKRVIQFVLKRASTTGRNYIFIGKQEIMCCFSELQEIETNSK